MDQELRENEPYLTVEDEELINIYNKIIDPTNKSIDWQGYSLWYMASGMNDFRNDADIILYIRSISNEFRNKE